MFGDLHVVESLDRGVGWLRIDLPPPAITVPSQLQQHANTSCNDQFKFVFHNENCCLTRLTFSHESFRAELLIDCTSSVKLFNDCSIVLASSVGGCTEYVLVFADAESCAAVWSAVGTTSG
jgi:hypothetical protein